MKKDLELILWSVFGGRSFTIFLTDARLISLIAENATAFLKQLIPVLYILVA